MKHTLLVAALGGLLAALAPTALVAQDQPAAASTRWGLFNWLDHRSFYNQGNFPEPFLVDDSGLEVNEARLDWLHTEASGSKSDNARVEIEKGFGLLTFELEIPYQRDSSPEGRTQGFANVNLGARHPLHQFVSARGFFDNTIGVALEAGIPTGSPVSKNAELVPKLFDDMRIGERFTLQSVLGHSTLFGPGDDSGLRTFEYGFVLGYTIQHRELPLPGILQLIPIFELSGDTELNHAAAGHNRLLGNAALRVNLKTLGRVQPRLGVGFVFPVDTGARAEVHRGIFTSLVFEY